VTTDRHGYYVDRRRENPKQWPGFLFNEWVPGAQHCVSHFRPFGKIDIFYYDAAVLAPSPWYRLPIRVLHDPEGIVADIIERSWGLPFTMSDDDLDSSISKGLAAAHETYRRARRGELFYALSLLDELRQHIMQADDWLHDRTPETAVAAKFDIRGALQFSRRSRCPTAHARPTPLCRRCVCWQKPIARRSWSCMASSALRVRSPRTLRLSTS